MVKALKDLTKDSLTYGSASMFSKIIGFLLIPLYTTYLTPVDYGITAMLSFVYLFFIPIASMGTTKAIFRRYNLNKDAEQQQIALSTGSIFVVFTSLVCLIIGLVFAGFITVQLTDDIKYLELVYITLGGCFFASIGMVFTVILRAKRKVLTLSIARIIELTFTIGLTIYLVMFLKIGVYGVVWGSAAGSCLLAVIQLAFCWKDLKPIFDVAELKSLLQYGLPFLPHGIFGNGINFLGQFFLKEYAGLASAGLYNISLKFALPLTFIIGAIQNAWVPIKFQIHREEEDEEDRRLVFRRLISTYFLFITIIYVGLVILGPELLRIMTQAEYHDAVMFFPLVVLISFSQGTYFMSGTGFEFTNNTKPAPLISGIGLMSLAIISFATRNWLEMYGILISMASCWFIMAYLVRNFAVRRFYVPLNLRILLIVFSLVFISTITSIGLQSSSDLIYRLEFGIILSIICIGILLRVFVIDEDFKSLNLDKYPMMGKLTRIILRIKQKIKT